MQWLTEPLWWLIDTFIHKLIAFTFLIIGPSMSVVLQQKCTQHWGKDFASRMTFYNAPELGFALEMLGSAADISSLLKSDDRDCIIAWCVFVRAKVLFSVGARDESLYIMIFRLIMQYARTLPWRNMTERSSNSWRSTIWIVTNRICGTESSLSESTNHAFVDQVFNRIFGSWNRWLFQNTMQVLNFPCSSGCEFDHGSHWCFWFLSSQIGNSSLQAQFIHCHLRFLHVQHVLLDSVGVSVCLSGSPSRNESLKHWACPCGTDQGRTEHPSSRAWHFSC